jgi:hypothetical protein
MATVPTLQFTIENGDVSVGYQKFDFISSKIPSNPSPTLDQIVL